MPKPVYWRLAAAMLASPLSVGAVQAAEGWDRTRWGMSQAEVSRLYPSLRPVAANRRLQCMDRVGSLEREGVVEAGGRSWSARFCFGPRSDTLRSVYLAAEGLAPDAAALTTDLTARHGRPLPQAADGTLPNLQQWRDGSTLVRLDTRGGNTRSLTYQSARPWPGGGLQPLTPAAASPGGPGSMLRRTEGLAALMARYGIAAKALAA